MKKTLICITFALMMTLPVGAGILCIPAVDEWLDTGSGYEFFTPLFQALDSHGSETNSDIIFGTLYTVSFTLSLMLAAALLAIVSRWRRTHRH
ncbi:hypothetical protein GXB81_28185 [Paraburkholderia sp. Ac-20336]|uniref:hypothetical protein n=1 Tax=Paraburkholderia sp. Ac-20336 TaxID=2703886 RepID=UPI0019812B38|nr:hypothetical protein [Paraburkholderia sp. Ac-20336]MBN3806898.1 hypothetical protein [Paraburkholderia sp. Ac-20336]